MPEYHVEIVLGNYYERHFNLQGFALGAMMKYGSWFTYKS